MSELKVYPFCMSKKLEVVKIDMKDPERDLIKCRYCKGQVTRYQWNTRPITGEELSHALRDKGMAGIPVALLEKLLSDNMRRSIGWRSSAIGELQQLLREHEDNDH